MDDEEDVKKMIEFLKFNREESVQEFQYEEFINCEESDAEAEEIDTSIIIENSIEDEIIYTDLSSTDISKLNTYDPRNSLKPEERIVIDSCPEVELKNLLLLNRTQNMQLIQLYKKMKDLLIECQKNITEKTKVIKAHVEASKDHGSSTGAWRLAAPYFKDKQLFQSPPNADTIRKRNNRELFTYDLSILPKWSTIECEKLIRAVKLNYNINQQNELVKVIQKAKQDGNLKLLERLENRKKELQGNDNSEIPPLNSNEHIDWMRVADVFLKDKHSAFECQSFWHLYLHPVINKSTWTPNENAMLKEIVKKYNFQNWDRIAEDLGTNRSGFAVCINYFCNLNDRFKKGEFTHQEDSRLLELVQQYKLGSYIPWTKIVQHFKKRTRSQLHYRYTYYLSQNDKKRGKFTDAEDVMLMILVDKFGKNYKKCCEYLPTRSMVQCKARYSTNLRNSIKKGSFTLEEDKIIMQYVEKHGSKSWANLTEKLRRARGQIRQRYLTISQFLDANPGSKISAVPRRRHKELEENSFPYLRSIADEYKDKQVIPSLDEIEEVLKNRSTRNIPNSSEDSEDDKESVKSNVRFATTPPNNIDIDEMLTSFFCNAVKMNATKMISSPNLSAATRGVEVVLDILKADLDIPENFDEDMALDNLDVAILNNLMEKKFKKCHYRKTESDDSITDLVPPNLNTVVGLRSLLIKFSHYRSQEKQSLTKFINGTQRQSSTAIRSDIVKHFLSLPPDIKERIEADRKLFYKRFHALFKWPAIMTMENPSADLISMAKGLRFDPPIQATRTYSRKEPPAKRMKISELPSTSSKAIPLKLTPVTNKSILEDLLHDKTKKLFCFNQVKSGSQTKTVIQEIPISKHLVTSGSSEVIKMKGPKKEFCTEFSFEAASSSNQEFSHFDTGHGECIISGVDEDNESVVTGAESSIVDDEEDLKKLNMLLNTEFEDEYEDDDMEDLQKLNIFLKSEVNDDISDESYG